VRDLRRDGRLDWAVLGVWLAWAAFVGVLVASFFVDSGWFLVFEVLLAAAILGFSLLVRQRGLRRV
jgi:hypothetical protein